MEEFRRRSNRETDSVMNFSLLLSPLTKTFWDYHIKWEIPFDSDIISSLKIRFDYASS